MAARWTLAAGHRAARGSATVYLSLAEAQRRRGAEAQRRRGDRVAAGWAIAAGHRAARFVLEAAEVYW